MAINEVYFGDTQLISLKNDTVATANDIMAGKIGHLNSGNIVTGTATNDATATATDILSGETAYVNGNKIIGTMPNNGSMTAGLSTKTATRIIPAGYTSGGTVSISTTEQNKIIADNIKNGITILGVPGTFTFDATASSSDIISGKTAYVNGNKVTGTGLDYNDFSLVCQKMQIFSVIIDEKSVEFPIPAFDIGGRSIKYMHIYTSDGNLSLTSNTSTTRYITDFTYSADGLIHGNRNYLFHSIILKRTSSKSSVEFPVYSSAMEGYWGALQNTNLLASGGAKVVVNNSHATVGYWRPSSTYYVLIGG